MQSWVPAVAKVSFYAGRTGAERPRWLKFAGEALPLEVLEELRVGSPQAGEEAVMLWLVGTRRGIFRVRLQGERCSVALWAGPQPPRGLADLLA